MNQPRRLLLSAALLLGASISQAGDDGIGRLFATPQKRAILDELRDSNARITPETPVEEVRVDGIVRRSSGASTVWINGRAYNDRAPVARVGDRSVDVIVGDGRRREVKVGQSLRVVPASGGAQ